MAVVIHGKTLDFAVVGKAVEDDTRNVDLTIDIDVVDATAASATAKANIEGNYGWSMDADFVWNDSSGEIDSVAFNMRSSGAQAVLLNPGGGAEGANNPEYGGNAILTGYRVTIPHDGLITSKGSFMGTGALTRDVTP